MAFNITSWSHTDRNFGRGDPPPVGSVEYVGVGDMFYGRAPGKKPAADAPPAPAPAASPSPAEAPRGGVGVGRLAFLALAGAACAGVAYLRSRRPREPVAVAVPDAYPEE